MIKFSRIKTHMQEENTKRQYVQLHDRAPCDSTTLVIFFFMASCVFGGIFFCFPQRLAQYHGIRIRKSMKGNDLMRSMGSSKNGGRSPPSRGISLSTPALYS
ncbi:hypothetical protein I7I50_05436 [Histoplasma capsulatum G186AR]|uniref:Uncharacterized protein n=1 Tax=Ajellomyces capsulatus TaxID=5037 RepID=A0A8H7Z6Z6_AJECA|nr:hypothetical protein I7I52_03697 [Histoplasma capsulatum]QSS76097.1 hypothetical protein I7I50_05436 [Histoplasma capsulatum G186AR]